MSVKKEHRETEPQPNNRKSHSKDTARTISQQDRKGHKDRFQKFKGSVFATFVALL